MPSNRIQNSKNISASTANKGRRWSYGCAAAFGLLHLCTIILHNIGHLWGGHGDGTSLGYLQQQLEPLQQNRWFRYYAQWAGIHGGYGFYSPQVGSSYHTQFTQVDSSVGRPSYDTPGLTSAATMIRYRSLLEARDGWFTASGEVNPLAKAILLSLCRHQANVHSEQQICCRYMALSVPKLSDYQTDDPAQPTYIVLYEHTYTPAYESSILYPDPHRRPLPITSGTGYTVGLGDTTAVE